MVETGEGAPRRARNRVALLAAALVAAAMATAGGAIAAEPTIAPPAVTIQNGLTPVLTRDFCEEAAGGDVVVPSADQAIAPVTEGHPMSPSGQYHHGGDMAFFGHRAVVSCGADDGDLRNDGFVVLDVKDPTNPQLLGSFFCVASATDIALWGDLVFLAVDRNNDTLPGPGPFIGDNGPLGGSGPFPGNTPTQPNYGPLGDSCDAPVLPHGAAFDPATGEPVTDRTAFFEGVRIVSIARPNAPALVRNLWYRRVGDPDAVPGDPVYHGLRVGGPHNLTLLPDQDDGIVRVLAASGDHSSQQLIEVPVEDPTATRSLLVNFAGCHDIAVFAPRNLALCSRSDGTHLWDLALGEVYPPSEGAPYWSYTPESGSKAAVSAEEEARGTTHHSSAVSWDGNTLIVTDENLRQAANQSCSDDTAAMGVVWFYDISNLSDPKPLDHHALGPVVGAQWCVSKQLSVLPLVNGTDVVAVSWGGGGTSLLELTRPTPNSIEVTQRAHFVASPGTRDGSTAWAAYWYRDHIFVNNVWGCAYGAYCLGSTERGLDVLAIDDVLTAEWGPTAKLHRFHFALQECIGTLTRC